MVEIEVTKELLLELQLATQKVLQQYRLGGSDLIKSIEYTYKDNVFVLVANDYFTYVSTGRRPRARKVPIEDLLKWMKDKGLRPKAGQTYNQLAFAIQDAIYKNGIKAKNYINPVMDVTTDIISEDFAENLSEQICTEIAEDLTFTLGKT
jgi:hypothetical protein